MARQAWFLFARFQAKVMKAMILLLDDDAFGCGSFVGRNVEEIGA